MLSPIQIAIVLVIALVVFGPKRLPELGKSAGNAMREFKASVSGLTGGDDGGKEADRIKDADVAKTGS